MNKNNKFFMLLFAVCIFSAATAQNNFKALIRDKESKELLFGVTAIVKGEGIGGVSDPEGRLDIVDIPPGTHIIRFNLIGFEPLEIEYNSFATDTSRVSVYLEHIGEELEEIVVQTTRSSRTIEEIPTRVEAIELEEIEEKSNMRPSNVTMLLHESTGIQVQQTSATSANASIRIQGLDGKYTQLLKDGYPNFGGFASGLSVLEIPPLDLKQVEVIKGPVSTLYGGGAIAGVVNFISKTPMRKSETQLLINQSHIGQTNAGIFSSRRNDKVGYTVLGLGNYQRLYDVDGDDFSELPLAKDFTFIPKLFFYPDEQTTISVGNSFTKGVRTGGDKFAVEERGDSLHTYFEKNNSLRNTTNFEYRRNTAKNHLINFKSSFNYFDRQIELPFYFFSGLNYNSYSEATYSHNVRSHSIIEGVNFVYDEFVEDVLIQNTDRSQTTYTTGIFVQDNWDVAEKAAIETGLRLDYSSYTLSGIKKRDLVFLPRVSGLFKWSSKLSSRVGMGLGYKTPTLFTEETEALQYRNILSLRSLKMERSFGSTADINYKTILYDHISINLNHMFFFTQITSPIVLQQNNVGEFYFENQNHPIRTLGFETNIKFTYNFFKLLTGYTYTNAKAYYQAGIKTLPLIPEHKLNLALLYEKHEAIKIGLEGYFSSRQFLNNGNFSRGYWEFGAMIEKIFPVFSIYINAENFTDTRQSNYKSVVNPPHDDPTFDDIWTHTEGFVLSGGIKIKI